MLKTVLIGVALSAAVAIPGVACTKPQSSGAFGKTINAARPDQTVFDQALRAWANYERCRTGEAALGENPGLHKAAVTHSRWMAQTGRLSHTSTVAGQQRLKGRFRSNGVSFRTGAENIAAWERFQFAGGSFQILDAGRCRYATTSGRVIPAHSYGSLAQAVVQGWMGSSGHRRNLLNARIRTAGGAVALDRDAGTCGRFYVTQDYAG